MLIARMLLVSLLSILINRFSSIKIGPKMQFVLMIGALRGGISYALAMNYNDSREQRAILTATLVSILFPIFMCGLPLPFILNKLGLVSETKPAKENELFIKQEARKMNMWRKIDIQYLTPLLVRKSTVNEENIANVSFIQELGAKQGILDATIELK